MNWLFFFMIYIILNLKSTQIHIINFLLTLQQIAFNKGSN